MIAIGIKKTRLKPVLQKYSQDFHLTDNIKADSARFLTHLGFPKTAQHCAAVAAKSSELAEFFECDPHKAEQAGYLHDISVVIAHDVRIEFARRHQVAVLEEEVQCPMILHQKLSVVLAREIFGVADPAVLSAIGCHTTLKANAARLDKVVFLADKIAWDQVGQPPYGAAVAAALETSLDAAVLVYLDYLWAQRATIQVLHPWFVAARHELLNVRQT